MPLVALDGADDCSAMLRAGVYALVKNGVVIYVGKSKSVYQRIYAHRSTANRAAKGKTIPSWLPLRGFVFDQVFIWPCTVDALADLEAEKINRYKPRYNESLKAGGPKVTQPITLQIGSAQLSMGPPPSPSTTGPGLRRLA